MKYIPWTVVLIGLLILCYTQYAAKNNALSLLSQTNQQLMTANLEIGRAKTELVSVKKVHSVALNKLNEDLKKEIETRQALIVSYGELEAELNAEKKKVKVETKIVYKDRIVTVDKPLPPGSLFSKKKDGTLEEVLSIPWKYDDFRISLEGDAYKGILSYKLHQKFKAQIIETRLKTGARNHYVKLYELDDKGKEITELKLTNFTMIKGDEEAPSWSWFNPKIDIGLSFAVSHTADISYLADIGVSLSSYGKTLNDLSWRAFRFSVGFVPSGVTLGFSPASYNIATVLPLVSNLWITPTVSYSFYTESAIFSLGISVVF